MGDWQKPYVRRLVELGLSYDMAMLVMGKTCELRQQAYMEGYNRGWEAALDQTKTTTTNSNEIPYDRINNLFKIS